MLRYNHDIVNKTAGLEISSGTGTNILLLQMMGGSG
jgi:hypothetical protein